MICSRPPLQRTRLLYVALIGLLGSVLSLMPAPAQAQSRVHVIGSDADLVAVMAQGVAGDELHLQPGEYTFINFEQGEAPAVIRSTDPSDPARINHLHVDGCTDLTISDVHLLFIPNPASETHARPFSITNCENVRLTRSRIEAGWMADGSRVGYALYVGHCTGMVIDQIVVTGFHRGLVAGTSRNLTIRNSEFTQIQSDGMNFVQIDRVLIEDNHLHTFARVPSAGDHSDMIQFWTRNSTEPSRDITIRNNLLHSGTGRGTQSIFMRNDQVDRGLAGRELFYRNVTIENNVIINAHTHGITLGESIGVSVRRNTLIQNANSVPDERPERALWVPTITVAPASSRVTITGNMAFNISGYQNQGDWVVADNLRIQPHTSLELGFYGRVFQGLPGGEATGLASYMYRLDGPAGDPDIGASLLQPPQ